MLSPSPLLLTLFLLSITTSVMAKDWNSMQELTLDLRVYRAFVFCTVGIHVWEHVTYGIPFEILVYTRRLPWRWGLVPYLVIRYSLYVHLIATIININADSTTGPIDCEGWLIALMISLSLATVLTTLIFIVRAIAIWRKSFWVALFLAVLWCATASMHFSSPARLRSKWSPQTQSCATYFVRSQSEYNTAYLLVMVTDMVCFALASWRLRSLTGSGIGRILFRQGMGYFGVAFVLNALCLAFLYANLNPLMGYVVSPFAAVMSGIMACRAFQDLQIGARQSHRFASSGGGANGNVWVRDGNADVIDLSASPRKTGWTSSGLDAPPDGPPSPYTPQHTDARTTFGGFDDDISAAADTIPMPVTTRFGPPISRCNPALQSPDSKHSFKQIDDIEEHANRHANGHHPQELLYVSSHGRHRSNSEKSGLATSDAADEVPFSGTTLAPSSPPSPAYPLMVSHPYANPRNAHGLSVAVPTYTLEREVHVQGGRDTSSERAIVRDAQAPAGSNCGDAR